MLRKNTIKLIDVERNAFNHHVQVHYKVNNSNKIEWSHISYDRYFTDEEIIEDLEQMTLILQKNHNKNGRYNYD